ncbi:MAG: NAD-glutamate dehydrogenase [Alphaproteobacteria bacterium]|nr:NAD-glutamate dehydrogenase [Alphaproteobacteria bacterium]
MGKVQAINMMKNRKSEQIEKIIDLASHYFPSTKKEILTLFTRHFFDHLTKDDLIYASPEHLAHYVSGVWEFLQDRQKNELKIRLKSNYDQENNWLGPKTIIEIIQTDMPFVVDSISSELLRLGFSPSLFLHPVFVIERDKNGKIMDFPKTSDTSKETISVECVMLLQLNESLSEFQKNDIEANLRRVLENVAQSVHDWQIMRKKLYSVINDMTFVPGLKIEDEEEARAFLQWLDQDHFTFLGYREYLYSAKNGKIQNRVLSDEALGLFKDPAFMLYEDEDNGDVPPEVQALSTRPDLIIFSKSTKRSPVHRPSFLDIVSIKKFSPKGDVVGDYQFIGLFTASAYHDKPELIPICRRKASSIVTRSGYHPKSHDGKAITHILNSFPRDELFQISAEELYEISLGILELMARPEIALFIRKDPFGRSISCFVYVPRDRYDTALREKFLKILELSFNGKVSAFYTHISDDNLARLHVILRIKRGFLPLYNLEEITEHLSLAAETWQDHLRLVLLNKKGEELGRDYFRQFSQAFPFSYRDKYAPEFALVDIEICFDVIQSQKLGINLFQLPDQDEELIYLKLYHLASPIHLSDVMPMFEGMGLRAISEVPFEVKVQELDESLWIHEFCLSSKLKIDLDQIKEKFENAFLKLWEGAIENDYLNALVITAQLTWKEITILRTYSRYLRQIGVHFSHNYLEETLVKHSHLAKTFVDIFYLYFDPKNESIDQSKIQEKSTYILKELVNVKNADEDRIIRRFLNLLHASLRVTYFQKNAFGKSHPYVAIKFDSRKIDELPLPKPFYEVFVYSPKVEAIHLRGGKVARGGIRWSDRREDFRTEVLGLMKAQTIKNALIVPVGAKGGFVVKSPNPTSQEVIDCYSILIRGLLDLTDNLYEDQIIYPKNVIRRDGDDPYLVVAADKGTASFSDIANKISQEYNFWLGDAFASGGSAGYDHKKMGITAKGAWESVKRHFYEMDKDIENESFTCIGVGDMAGDVFGNGMLLSDKIQLIAAFNHHAIFIDPNPDPLTSFNERKRLFDLPRSTWLDYTQKSISKGGGVFLRSEKSITLTPEIKILFGLTQDEIEPNALIREILRFKIDLLWFGGIGTFIKSSFENNAEVGDRANDALRINAKELNAKIIGEGANLAITQLGRIQFALNGGRLNTDSIDNAGGVNCSDHEVNIKILLNDVMRAGELTLIDRNKLLLEMTDEVGKLVIRDNYLQTQALTHAEEQGFDHANHYSRLIQYLEKKGMLDRVLEKLPDEETMKERRLHKKGLTRPELSVLIAHAKLTLTRSLSDNKFADDPALDQELMHYFPKQIQEQFPEQILKHSLKHEITTMMVTNDIVNRAGIAFVNEKIRKTGSSASDVVRAYLITRHIFNLDDIWSQIEALDGKVAVNVQLMLVARVRRLLQRVTLWLLRYCAHPLKLNENIEFFGQDIKILTESFNQIIDQNDQDHLETRVSEFTRQNVPESLARNIANMSFLNSACDIIRIGHYTHLSVIEVARVFFAVGKRFSLNWLRQSARLVDVENQWQKIAISSLVEEFYAHQAGITIDMMHHKENIKEVLMQNWLDLHNEPILPIDEMIKELKSLPVLDIPMLMVMNNQLKSLTPLN